MLHINNLTYRVGQRVLFDQATVLVASGHRVGFVGRNGSGKTTLFRLILGEIEDHDSSIKIRKGMSVGTVAQEAPSGPESLIDTVLAADMELTDLNSRAETATDPQEISEIHIRLADINAQTATARAARILAGLGFSDEAQNRRCTEFSGGWRMRVALAATLFANPDLLLLDEPTAGMARHDTNRTIDLLQKIKERGMTKVIIEHDMHVVFSLADRISVLARGHIIATGTPDQIKNNPKVLL